MFSGSVSGSVIKQAPCSVLILEPEYGNARGRSGAVAALQHVYERLGSSIAGSGDLGQNDRYDPPMVNPESLQQLVGLSAPGDLSNAQFVPTESFSGESGEDGVTNSAVFVMVLNRDDEPVGVPCRSDQFLPIDRPDTEQIDDPDCNALPLERHIRAQCLRHRYSRGHNQGTVIAAFTEHLAFTNRELLLRPVQYRRDRPASPEIARAGVFCHQPCGPPGAGRIGRI